MKDNTTTRQMIAVPNTPFEYAAGLQDDLDALSQRVGNMRAMGKLSRDAMQRIRRYFRIKNIYHSNAIEGNVLNVGETRQVVELGLTLSGKPLKDQAEAKNLGDALDFLESLAGRDSEPIRAHDIRQIHSLILQGINDDEAGAYRSVQVEISGSSYSPPLPEDVHPQMDEFFDAIGPLSIPSDNESVGNPIPLAVAAHAWFAQIHPFIDGNGRTARILMNLILMRFGYPISIITREDRIRYYDALEESQVSDLSPLMSLVIESVSETLEEYERAVEEQRGQTEWAQALVDRFTESERIRASNEYEVWRGSMDLLAGHFRQLVQVLNDTSGNLGQIYFKDFGNLEYEKYLALRQGESAKKTWFFRIDFVRGERSARYLFFFGYASVPMRTFTNVTVHVAREERPYHFERLDQVTDASSLLMELGYSPSDEQFVARYGFTDCRKQRINTIGENFFEDVVRLHF